MKVARQLPAWNRHNSVPSRRDGVRWFDQPQRFYFACDRPNAWIDHTVPDGRICFLTASQAMNRLATLIQSLRDKPFCPFTIHALQIVAEPA